MRHDVSQKIAGRKDAAVSSLVWCQPEDEDEPRGRLFSAALDGFITEWDLRTLQPKVGLPTCMWRHHGVSLSEFGFFLLDHKPYF